MKHKDKLLHLITGFLIGLIPILISYFTYLDMLSIAPILAALTAGFIKEMFDIFKGGKFSWLDLLATFAGGILANLIKFLV